MGEKESGGEKKREIATSKHSKLLHHIFKQKASREITGGDRMKRTNFFGWEEVKREVTFFFFTQKKLKKGGNKKIPYSWLCTSDYSSSQSRNELDSTGYLTRTCHVFLGKKRKRKKKYVFFTICLFMIHRVHNY